MRALLIFDGDDTLWSTEPLYDAARSSARAVVEACGFDGARWELAERTRDVANVGRFGLSRARFPTSCVEALADVVPGGTEEVSPELRRLVWDTAASVFRAPAIPVSGAHEVLAALAEDHTVVLLTKGDSTIQEWRVASSGLRPLLDHVEIVAEKTPETFRQVVCQLGFDPGHAVSIGNSLPSDIFPAVAAGLRAVWIDAHVWEYERSKSRQVLPKGAVAIYSLPDLPATLKELALSV